MTKKTKLKELFIEDLGKATGGRGRSTTRASGEEGPLPTSVLTGEEDAATTLALGEEGGDDPSL